MHNHKFLVLEWDCCKEENSSNNSELIKKLNLDFLPDYKTKYTRKIYMNKKMVVSHGIL